LILCRASESQLTPCLLLFHRREGEIMGHALPRRVQRMSCIFKAPERVTFREPWAQPWVKRNDQMIRSSAGATRLRRYAPSGPGVGTERSVTWGFTPGYPCVSALRSFSTSFCANFFLFSADVIFAFTNSPPCPPLFHRREGENDGACSTPARSGGELFFTRPRRGHI